MNVRDALARAADYLTCRAVDSPEVDAEWLLGHVVRLTRTQLQLEHERDLSPEEDAAFWAFVERRGQREPLAYVLGEWGFRRLTLKVDPRALIPRPETEVVVERCLARLAGLAAPRVLDVGVGSGAIALAILDELPGALVTGVDRSQAALGLAAENRASTGLPLELREGGAEVAGEGWDLVVSNPPYVSAAELTLLEPEIRDWEPREALVGGGLHEQIAAAARTTWLVLEVADEQAPAVAGSLSRLGYREVTITLDLAGRRRVVEGRRS